MNRRALIFFGAIVMSMLAGTTAFAKAPPGTVTVPIVGCTFRVLIDLDQAYDVVGWKVKQYNAVNWNDGLTLFKGSGPTDPTGALEVGPFTAPDGHDTVAVDNEYPPAGSSIVVDFRLSCPVATPSASTNPSPSDIPSELPIVGSPSPSPSASDIPSELPIAGSGAPSGDVKGIHGTPPPGVTPPPTDAVGRVATPDDSGWRVILMGLAALIAASVLVLPRPATGRIPVRRGRR